MTVYTGNSLTTACESTTPVTVYYNGVLNEGTILYAGPGYTNPVLPITYLRQYDNQVYVVGVESVIDGTITAIAACPTPTPTPTAIPEDPTVYVYEKCPTGEQNPIYYWKNNLTASHAIDGSNNCYLRITTSTELLSTLVTLYSGLTQNGDLEPSNYTQCPCN
jgi:hypothetical protein